MIHHQAMHPSSSNLIFCAFHLEKSDLVVTLDKFDPFCRKEEHPLFRLARLLKSKGNETSMVTTYWCCTFVRMDVHLYTSREERKKISFQAFSPCRYLFWKITLSRQILISGCRSHDFKKMEWFLPSQKRLNGFIAEDPLKVLQKMRTTQCLSQDNVNAMDSNLFAR